jgi:hypothetical protein
MAPELRLTKAQLERAHEELERKLDTIRTLQTAAATTKRFSEPIDFLYGFMAGSMFVTGMSILIHRFC